MTDNRALTITDMSANEVLAGMKAVKDVLAPDLTDAELRLFAMVAQRSGLDPWAHQIYAVKRKGRVTFQTSIDGYRSIAARTGMYDGQDEPEFGPDCPCTDAPDPHPLFATVKVYRKSVSRPIGASAFWHEYKPEPGPSGQGDVMWVRMPHVMIAKVAEALALRKGFPYDPERREGIGADIYTADEMAQAGNERPSARARIIARAIEIKPPAESVVGDPDLDPIPPPVDDFGDDADDHPDASTTDEGNGPPEPSPAPVAPIRPAPEGCGAVAADPIMEGSICTLKAGHLGVHRAGRGSWPR